MGQITLQKGICLIDDNDLPLVTGGLNWYVDVRGYAVRNYFLPNGRKTIQYMHRLLMETPVGMHTDHINGNKLDNRRTNLRVCTPSQNILNSKLSKSNNSGVKGVSRSRNRWKARIMINRKDITIGYFSDLADAIGARVTAYEEYYGT